MSFPTPRSPGGAPTPQYRGRVFGPNDGEAYHWLGSLTLTKVTGAMTRGGLDIVDHRVPAGYAPPPHVHRDQDEVFYLIEGTLEVMCGDEHWQAEPGSLVFLPRGVQHGFTAGSDGPVRTPLFNAPAGFADVVTELGTLTTGLSLPASDVGMPGPDTTAEVSARHGIEPAPTPESGKSQ